jgi:hypothetical protein
MNRMALWALASFASGLGLGAALGGGALADTQGQNDDAWMMPEEATVPRHDAAAFAESFGGLRWPSGQAQGSEVPTGGLAGWRLLGIVSTGNSRHALLLPADGGRALRVAQGEALPGGINVERLEGTRITLRDSQRCTLILGMPARQDAQVRCPP